SPDGIQFPDQVEYVLHGHHTGIRAEIFALGWLIPARIDDPREPLFQNADVREGRVILQQDIVLRLVLLDEVVFEQKGIEFRLRQNVFNVLYLRNKAARLGMESCDLVEIAGNPFPYVLGFADIDQYAFRIEEFIYSGRAR